jgi:hypothetical protein
MLSRRMLKPTLRGITGTNPRTARRHASKDIAAAQFAYDDAYDAGPGGAALEEERDGGGSDSRLDIQYVLMSSSAYMRQADTRRGRSRSATTCLSPHAFKSDRFHPRPRRTWSRRRSPALRLLHFDHHVHPLHVRLTAAEGTFSRPSRAIRRGRLVRDRDGALLRRALARFHHWPRLERL